MKVMFIFSMPTRVLLQITINSLPTSHIYATDYSYYQLMMYARSGIHP
jgi:hypothetical protein